MVVTKKKLLDNKDVLKEKSRNQCRNLSEEEKEVKETNERDRYRNMTMVKRIG